MDVVSATRAVRNGDELDVADVVRLFGDVLDGSFDPAQLAALLTAMAETGERVEHVLGAAVALRRRMVRFEHAHPGAIDTCGTGGDGIGSFNISTAAAIVAAAAGAKVVKHGNRNQSSRCGSADLLEAAGVPLDATPAGSRAVLDEVGITFLYAPAYHPLLARVAPVRKHLARRTVFNWLGPLCNPGDVQAQVIGSATERGLYMLAESLQELDSSDAPDVDPDELPLRRALVVHGAGGADELTLQGRNHVGAVNMRRHELDARTFRLQTAPVASLAGGDARANLALLRTVLDAEPSPIYDAVRLNATAALLVHDGSEPRAAFAAATEALESGRARDTFFRWIDAARRWKGTA